ncbi:MAG: hypothetical protein HYT31_01195 [Parcubacteria group bacterium]|nr:hypothetical protein [Parcubacteria group bacterium]
MKFSYKETSHISERDAARAGHELSGYLEELRVAAADASYASNESCLHLPSDETLRAEVSRLAHEKSSRRLHEVMVVGIGGSNLGTWAVYDALKPGGVPLSFFDTAHVRLLKEACQRMRAIYRKKGRVLINVISKSGTTSETMMNARVLIDCLKSLTKHWRESVVVTTEPQSLLDHWARAQDVPSLPNPPNVGGRWSVFSAVGLFQLALAGVDIKKLHKGAVRALRRCLSNDEEHNAALQSAVAIHHAMKKGVAIHNTFIFNQDLERVGKWYRQLVGESLGKERDLSGRIVHAGITPLVTIGSTDLHSVFQLLLGGPEDKFTTFVKVRAKQDISIPRVDEEFDAIVPELNRKSVGEVMDAIYTGTVRSFADRSLPFVEVELERLDEESLGEFLQFKMVETMLLARLMRVNAFDQPNVEEYKVITRELLH